MKNSEMVRGAIESLHQAIERTPFAMAMFAQKFDPAIYANGLAQFWHIHDALEASIPGANSIASFFTVDMIRTPAIERDLATFGYRATDFEILDDTRAMVEALHAWSIDRPFALVGSLYILEGSRMGSLVIAKPLAKALGLAEDAISGLEYHLDGARGTPLRVRQLKQQMDLIEDENAIAAMRDGAVVFMQDFFALYESLGAGLPARNSASGHDKSLPLAS